MRYIIYDKVSVCQDQGKKQKKYNNVFSMCIAMQSMLTQIFQFL